MLSDSETKLARLWAGLADKTLTLPARATFGSWREHTRSKPPDSILRRIRRLGNLTAINVDS